MTRLLPPTIASLLLVSTSLTLAQARDSAWQLASADHGTAATVELPVTDTTLLDGLDGIAIPGARVAGFGIDFQQSSLSVELEYTDGQPLVFSEISLLHGDGQTDLEVIPSEVHWLNPDPTYALQVPDLLRLSGAPMVIVMVLENMSGSDIVLTDFRFAPEDLSSGQFYLAHGFGSVDVRHLGELPHLALGTGQVERFTWQNIPFRQFTFARGEVPLAPGDQAILVATGDAMTDPQLFAVERTTLWAPWLEYMRGGQLYHLPLARIRAGD